MTIAELERRLGELENEVAQLKSQLARQAGPNDPWWRQIVGQFEGDDAYAEIVRLGREIRRADRPE